MITIADDIKIDAFLKIGDNTTINAYGHTVTTTEKKGVILNYADALDYGALKNVAINGGTWRAASGYKKTMMRFAHAEAMKMWTDKIDELRAKNKKLRYDVKHPARSTARRAKRRLIKKIRTRSAKK